MIEEIKMIVQLLSKVTDGALYGLLGYGVYKLIMYLSMTGSIVYISKLGINRLFDYLEGSRGKK